MHKELRPEQVDILAASPAVNDEFSKKIKELDRRLQMNGMNYREWDTLNDRQHDIFTDNLFLDGECASSPEQYVKGAVASCGCPDTEEELYHHSPVLMGEIEKQEDMLPDVTVKIGESLNNLNETIDLLLEGILFEAAEQTLEADINEIYLAYLINGSSYEGIYAAGADPEKQVQKRETQLKEEFPNDADTRIERQKRRAAAMYDVLKSAGHLSQPIARVAWTARPGSLGSFVHGEDKDGNPVKDVDQRLNSSDLVVEFSEPYDEAGNTFLGISAKSTKQDKGEIAWANRGIGSLLNPSLTKKEKEAGLTLDPRQSALGTAGINDFKSIEVARRSFEKTILARTAASLSERGWAAVPALSLIRGKQNKKTGEFKVSGQDIKTFVKRLEKTINPISDPSEEGYDTTLKGVTPFTEEELGPELAAQLVQEIKKYGGLLLKYARNRLLQTYKDLDPAVFRDHFLYFWVRQFGDALTPPVIKVTGRGNKPPYSATISKDSEKALKINSSNNFVFEPVGRDSVGIKDGDGNKLAKIRMKFSSRAFSSIKPTGEAW
jgi:hypothetical protein